MVDFFISYNNADRHWAMGLGDWLDQAGFSTISQEQDFVPSTNFVHEMHKASQTAKRMILVLSQDYLTAKFPLAEWTSVFAKDPTCENGTLIPVRVRECKPEGLLKPIVYIDLVGLHVDEARKVFLAGIQSVVDRKRAKIKNTSIESALKKSAVKRQRKQPTQNQNVSGNNNTTIQAGEIKNLTIKSSSKKPLSIQPVDAIGSNIEMKSYIEYLVGQYIDWRKAGIAKGFDKRSFHPSMIHKDIKREFGSRTYLVSQSKFDDLVHYLQNRIDKTIEGKNNPYRNYHSYEEHKKLLREGGKPKK